MIWSPYLQGPHGLPVARSMYQSDKSLAQCLLASTAVVTPAVVKLWARASNQATEDAACHAVAEARRKLRRAPWSEAQIQALPDGPPRRTQALLAVMGLVFPGTRLFQRASDYLLLPSDSRKLLGTARPHPFGVLILGDVVHVFTHNRDVNGSARGLNIVLHTFHQACPEFRLVVHTLYCGVSPNAHLPLKTRWPLLVLPSLLAHWFVPATGLGYPTHVTLLHPTTTTIQEAHPLPEAKNWDGWLGLGHLVEQRLKNLIPGLTPAQWLGYVPQAVARREAAEKRRLGHERQLERERQAAWGKPNLRFAPVQEPVREFPPCAALNDVFAPDETKGDQLL